MDRDLRDWLRSLAVHHDDGDPPAGGELSEEGAAYLERIAQDGTLSAALAEIVKGQQDLRGGGHENCAVVATSSARPRPPDLIMG